MHETKPTQPIINNDKKSPCKIINKNFIKHEKLIRQAIKNNPEIMQQVNQHPYKEMRVQS